MNSCYPFINTPLPYDYDALEPYIDTQTMMLHHDRHLGTYIKNLNKAIKYFPSVRRMSLVDMLRNPSKIPCEIRTQVLRNAGGVYNHRLFFNTMSPQAKTRPDGQIGNMITKQIGGYDNFADKLKEAAMSVFGSGYAWLVVCKNNSLKIVTTANQETPLSNGLYPLLNLDVWEHAYYLKHYNERSKYIDDWFRVLDFNKVEERYKEHCDLI